MVHMANAIVVRGIGIDLEAVYERMCAEAARAADGRLIHTRGLKYLLAELYGMRPPGRVPSQPLFDMRRETAAALCQLGWVAPFTRNNGRYELVRSP
jgi:hypothetical protein